MENKKVTILIVLSVFAVISIVRGIVTPPKYRRSMAPQAAAGLQQASGAQATMNHAVMKRHAKRTKFKSWKRNPFGPASSGTSTGLVLNGIIWSKDRPKAMIGDSIVAKGDVVNDNKVVDIKPDRVILNDGVNNFELKMEK